MLQEIQCEFPPGFNGSALLERLEQVIDPELDESLLRLGFIHSLTVKDKHVTVEVRLPTSWCAANFTYMMAEDIRNTLLNDEDIDRVTVRLGSHYAAETIEAAVNAGKPFPEAFPGEGCGSLAHLRATFLRKGFTNRQVRLLSELLAAGLSPQFICSIRIADTSAQGGVYFVHPASKESIQIGPAETLNRYLTRRKELGLPCNPLTLLITDYKNRRLTAELFDAYYQEGRTVRVSLEANGSFCRAVLAARQSQYIPLDNVITK